MTTDLIDSEQLRRWEVQSKAIKHLCSHPIKWMLSVNNHIHIRAWSDLSFQSVNFGTTHKWGRARIFTTTDTDGTKWFHIGAHDLNWLIKCKVAEEVFNCNCTHLFSFQDMAVRDYVYKFVQPSPDYLNQID